MKKDCLSIFALISMALFACLTTGCVGGSDWDDWEDWTDPNGGNGNSSSGSGSAGNLMTFSDLSTFTVEKNTASLSESETIPTSEDDTYYTSYVENNFSEKYAVTVKYNGTNDASVSGLVDGDTITVSGGNVEIKAHGKGLALNVSGTTTNGSLKIYSEKKFRLNLNSATITNPDGAAINIQNGNCFLVLTGTNTLSDGSSATYTKPDSEDMKAVLFSEDDIRLSGSGTLVVNALNAAGKAAISSDDEIFIRPNTNIQISSSSSAGNGIKANESIVMKGGVVNIETAAAGSKGLSSDCYMEIDGGRLIAITTGGVDTSVSSDPSGCAALKTDSVMCINGGDIYLKSTGQGGKGISSDDNIFINGGTLHIITEGSKYGSSSSSNGGGLGGGFGGFGGSSSSNTSVSPKGIKGDKNITISGGDVLIRTSGSNAEGIESKATLTFSGGNTASLAYDDGFNASTAINITGGKALAVSSGQCDGMDSNGSISATGGVLIGVSSTLGSEDGIDYQSSMTVSNATVIGLSTTGMSSRCNGHYISTTISGSSGAYVALCKDSKPLVVFQLPRTYSNGRLLLSAPSLASGSYSIVNGTTPSGGTSWMNYYDGATSVSGGSSSNVTAQ